MPKVKGTIITNINFYDYGSYDAEEERTISSLRLKEKQISIKEKYTFELINLVAQFDENLEVKDKIVKWLLQIRLKRNVAVYCKYQKLDDFYSNLAKEENNIHIIIKNIFKVQSIKIDFTLNRQIKILIEKIHNAYKEKIVYKRVSIIQSFIHKTVEEYNGKGSSYKLPVKLMRDSLSAIRLYLNIYDFRNLNLNSLFNNVTQESYLSEYGEKFSKKRQFLRKKDKVYFYYLKNNLAYDNKHLRSLITYDNDLFNLLISMESLNINDTLYKDKIINLVSDSKLST